MNADTIRFLATLLVLLPSIALADDWTPPDNPDLKAILQEAMADTQAKKYEVALAKHIWFHENALRLDPAMSSVRLSFALSNWEELGREYPAALEKLRSIRDSLEERVKRGEDIGSDFHELASINRTLDDDSRTAESFKLLDTLNPKAAKEAVHFAKRALIKDKAYELYLKYVDAKRDFLQIKHMYEMTKQRAADPTVGKSLSDHVEKTFRNNSATLVAILVLNKRNLEAYEIATLAKKELENLQFHQELEAALAGTIPTSGP